MFLKIPKIKIFILYNKTSVLEAKNSLKLGKTNEISLKTWDNPIEEI